MSVFLFFFQAEDGIRDVAVTGVQTCALPILRNCASIVRTGPGMKSFALRTEDGRAIPYQILDRRPGLERLDAARHYPDQDEVDWVRVALRAPSTPGMGFAVLAGDRPPPAPARTGAVGGRGPPPLNPA